MTIPNLPLAERFAPAQFTLHAPYELHDEIRVDQLCAELLQTFCRDLVAAGVDPMTAGSHARYADYFLRDFVIADRHDNLLELPRGRITQFGGHWYIIRNLEPNRAELASILAGVVAFYRYCATHGLVGAAVAERVADECDALDFFSERIEAFWSVDKDGYAAWEQGCPLKSRPGEQ